MTYCVGIKMDAGLLFASDTRTNAGVDNVSRYCKMRVFEQPGDRVIVALSSGNLSITQNVLSLVEQRARDGSLPSVLNVPSMYDVAVLFGQAMREVKLRDGPSLLASNVDIGANFIIGGQVGGEEPRLFMMYTEGNFIEATRDSSYLQIGEIKYGKPIIDRIITPDVTMVRAIKATLVSFDSTMRSNISVGLPIDLMVYRTGELRVGVRRRFDESDAYFQMIHNTWGDGLKQVFAGLPHPEWLD